MRNNNMNTIRSFTAFVFLLLSKLVCADTAILAGGCFWCTQSDLAKLSGVLKTEVGFDGGYKKNPSYRQVASGVTKYVESVRVEYDPKKLSYLKLVRYFLRTVDVTQKNGQFCDKGTQYRSVIFYLNDKQRKLANMAIKELSPFFPKVVTQVLPSTTFYLAEEKHQNYAVKNPIRYKYYRWRCGRDKQLKKIWLNKKDKLDNHFKEDQGA